MRDFSTPKVSIVLQPPNTIAVSVSEGQFNACAKWNARKAFIPLGSGAACVTPKESLNMFINVSSRPANKKAGKGVYELVLSGCKLNSHLDVHIRGAIGAVLRTLRRFMEGIVQNQIGKILCSVVKENVAALFGVDSELTPNKYYKIKNKFTAFNVTKNELFADLTTVFIPLL